MVLVVENTVFQSNQLLAFSRPSKYWKIIGENNSVQAHAEESNNAFQPLSESDLQHSTTLNATLQGKMIVLPSCCSPITEPMVELADPVDLRKDKENDDNESITKDNELLFNKTNKSSMKLKFGIESILEKSDKVAEVGEKKVSNQSSDQNISQENDESNDTKYNREVRKKCVSSHSEDKDTSTEMILNKQSSPQLSFLPVEHSQQDTPSNPRKKMNSEKVKKLSHHFHPYSPKNEAVFLQNSSNIFNELMTSISEQRNKEPSESSDRNSPLKMASNHFMKSPCFQTVNHTSDENSLDLPSKKAYNTAKLKRSSPIYKSSNVANTETRSKSVNFSPFDLTLTSKNRTNLENSGSSNDKLSPLLQTTFNATNQRIENEIKERLTPETDDVFNDNANKQSPPSGHFTPYIMKQRYFPGHGPHPIPSPHGPLTVFEDLKQGEAEFFPPIGITSNNAALFSPAFNAQLNFQSWQHALASTYPSFRQMIFPYSYNHTAALAMATAIRQSSKTLASQSVLLENFADKSNVNVADPRNGQLSFNDKPGSGPRKRRKWSRAVFSLIQRRGLEKSFQVQKYVAKPERKGLAEALGLTDAQVKIWFQNRRMKWRQEQKDGNKNSLGSEELSPTSGDDNPTQSELK